MTTRETSRRLSPLGRKHGIVALADLPVLVEEPLAAESPGGGGWEAESSHPRFVSVKRWSWQFESGISCT